MTPLSKPVTRATTRGLPASFLADRERKLVVTLRPGDDQLGDLITLRPHRRRDGAVTLSLADVYRYGLRIQAAMRALEKAKRAKARKADQRMARAERRLFTQIPIED